MATPSLLKSITLGTLSGAMLLQACSSATLIQSVPEGAKVYFEDSYKGTTPLRHRDMKVSGSITDIKLEKEGYETLHAEIRKNGRAHAGAIVGGIFFWFPFIWTMGYEKLHTYELKPVAINNTTQDGKPEQSDKATQLRELKKLLDEGVITQEEFEQEKKKILK